MVERMHNYSKLRITLDFGMDENEKEILKAKTFSNVKEDAEDEALYEVGTVFAGLTTCETLFDVERISSNSIFYA